MCSTQNSQTEDMSAGARAGVCVLYYIHTYIHSSFVDRLGGRKSQTSFYTRRRDDVRH